MIRKVYLKIATQALVFAAALNAAAKALWLTPLTAKLGPYFKTGHYRSMVLVALELLLLLIFYKLLSATILWAFDRFRWVRVLVDRLFDVEGSYLESVYINDELEVVGIIQGCNSTSSQLVQCVAGSRLGSSQISQKRTKLLGQSVVPRAPRNVCAEE